MAETYASSTSEHNSEIACEETEGEANDSKKYKSQVWRFFTKKGEKSITYTICSASLAYHGGTTSMLQHLRRKHPSENLVKPPDKQKQTKLDIFSRKRVCAIERAGAISD